MPATISSATTPPLSPEDVTYARDAPPIDWFMRPSAPAESGAHSLVLWDLDSVLLHARRLDREAHRVAFAELTGARPRHEPLLSDQSDPRFAVALLRCNGSTEGRARLMLPLYLPALVTAYRTLVRRRPWLLPQRCERSFARMRRNASVPGVVQSFVSARLRPNALLALKAVGLDRYLDPRVAAFGSDHVDMDGIATTAVRRAEYAHGRNLAHLAPNLVSLRDRRHRADRSA
ncbi:hypothetical protein GCM10009799_51740 [Nocardiopsis rhodophaea]|uniref:Uncharacterized protein n=1 Tax=Nocardiopsis rhodophaea TaxID=280238 RepID=A0ABN2TRH6_9ACTN